MEIMDTNYAAPRRSPEAEVAEESRGGRAVALAAFVVAVVVQVYVLYLFVPGPSTDVTVPQADKIVHLAVFGAPAFFAALARLPLWGVATLLAMHAPVSELIQHSLIAGRSGEPLDVAADLVGVGLGSLAGLAMHRYTRGTIARTADR